MSRKRFYCVLLVLVTAILLCGGWTYRQHQRYKHFAIHEPGMLYRSAWLDPDVISEVIETYQIRTVVNLCKPGEMGARRWHKERAAVTNAGARLIESTMPIGIDASDPRIEKHIELLSNPNNYPMLVHCQHGVTRTAKFLAIYDIVFLGLSGEESLTAQPLFGRDEHNVNVRAFVKNVESLHRELDPTATAEKLDVLRR